MTTALSMPTTRSTGRGRLRTAALGLAAVVALGGLLASVAVYVARGAIIAKAERVAADFGLKVAIGDVDIPLAGGIGLRDVEVTRADGAPIAHLERVETDISLVGAALGERRPERIMIAGGDAIIRWDDGFSDLRPSSSGSSDSAGSGRPIAVQIRDLEVTIAARHTTPLGVVQAEPLVVGRLTASLSRDSQRRLEARAEGALSTAGHRTDFSASLDQATGEIILDAADGIEVGLETPRGPMWVALNGARLQRSGPLVAHGLGLRRGDSLLQLGEVALRRGEDGLLSSVTLKDVSGTAASGGRTLSGQVGVVEVELSNLAAHLADSKSPLAAISSVRLDAPAVTLVLPARRRDNGDAASPAASDEEEPPPFVGNDEDLPPPGTVVPALAPGRDWLAALLGVEDESEGAGLNRFIPGEFEGRLPALLERLRALAPRVSNGTLAVRDSDGRTLLTLQDAGFSAGPSKQDPDGDNVALRLRAAVLREGGEAGRADLELELAPDLELDALEGTISGRSLAHQMARFVGGLSVQEDSEFDLEIRYQRPRSDNAPHHVEGVLRLASFSFEFWRIADKEIRDLEATVQFEASIDRDNHRLLLSMPRIEVGAARLAASLDLTRKKGHRPRFVARLEMPRQDCGAVARSIPRGLISNLPTLRLRGQIEFEAQLTLDLEKPRELDLRVTGDTEDCQVVSLGPRIDLEGLRRYFVHHPREPERGVLTHIAVGRGTRQWVPSHRLPDIVKTAAWVTEDRRFEDHGGVRWDLVERALKIDLDYGRFIYGGSTITQQLVKNLYLTRSKNLSRKLEEAIIAWQMERVLTKDEILTIYINCIEYGPDIYGVKAAARVYFDKDVDALDALEAAFIMGLKPYPSSGYKQFRKQKLDPWWIRRVSHVLRLMAKYEPDHISLEEAEAFFPFQPRFAEFPEE